MGGTGISGVAVDGYEGMTGFPGGITGGRVRGDDGGFEGIAGGRIWGDDGGFEGIAGGRIWGDGCFRGDCGGLGFGISGRGCLGSAFRTLDRKRGNLGCSIEGGCGQAVLQRSHSFAQPRHAPVAQRIERQRPKLRVGGSSPSRGTTLYLSITLAPALPGCRGQLPLLSCLAYCLPVSALGSGASGLGVFRPAFFYLVYSPWRSHIECPSLVASVLSGRRDYADRTVHGIPGPR